MRPRLWAVVAALAIGAAGLASALVLASESDIQTTYRDHMLMTLRAPEQPGDRTRADAIVAAARQVMAQYPTVEAAEKAGFTKFLPNIPLPIEHYVSSRNARAAWLGHFDALRPTALIFKRQDDGLHIVGVMYTAAGAADRADLNARVPLSFGTWHRHVKFCRAPSGTPLSERFGPTARFGFQGSIDTRAACEAAGGTFLPFVFGWMVHVWPMEKTQSAIWAVDAHDEMNGSMRM